jgi:hypothetical protein
MSQAQLYEAGAGRRPGHPGANPGAAGPAKPFLEWRTGLACDYMEPRSLIDQLAFSGLVIC